MRSTQFVVLLTIALNGKLSMTAIADELTLDKTTLTRLLAPLIESKMLKSEVGADRRSKILSITSIGKKKILEIIPYWKRAQSRVIGIYGTKSWVALVNELSRISQI